MDARLDVSRRGFMGGVAGAMSALALPPDLARWAEAHRSPRRLRIDGTVDPYDDFAKLAFNENPYGPPTSVMKAMTDAFKYANRYGYPDSGLNKQIAELHGVSPDMVLVASGSGELLEAVGLTYLKAGQYVIGCDPSYGDVYQHATRIKAEAIKVPLRADHTQDIPAMIQMAQARAKDVGFVYLCNPNNPTGRTIPAREVQQLLDGLPVGMPVLIDEAYHHFVDDPAYATSIPAAIAGRPVVVTRTFSKIAALAGIRLGYAIAPKPMIEALRLHMTGTVNVLAKYAGAAALRDTEAQAHVRAVTLELRRKTTRELARRGFAVIPSETNFFMVHIKRPVRPVIDAFKQQGVLVGRPFEPMTDYLRVSVGAPDEMQRFLSAWDQVMT